MRLFTPAFHRALHRDAYVVDTSRLLRPLRLDPLPDAGPAVAALLDRLQLMGKSPYPVRQRTFAVLASRHGTSFAVGATAPFHHGIVAAMEDALAAFGPVRREPDEPASAGGYFPLLAYERGRVAFFDSGPTHPWAPLAGRRGLRVLAATVSHAPDAEVFVGGRPAAAYLEAPDETTLDLDAIEDLPEDELNLLLGEQLKDREQPGNRRPS